MYVFSFYYHIPVEAHACILFWLSVYFVYYGKSNKTCMGNCDFCKFVDFFFNFVTFINCFPISSVNFTDKSFKVASS